MKKVYCFAALFGAILGVSLASCNSEEEELNESPVSEEIIFDNKGELPDTDEEVLFSTFDNVKQNGLKGLNDINTYDLTVLHSANDDLPTYYIDQNGGYFSRINIDLNNGAGGEWMYLYYRAIPYTSTEAKVTYLVGLASSYACSQSTLRDYVNKSNFTPFARVKDYGFVTDRNGNLVNLNAGSGGKNVYLGMTKNQYFAPITGIQIVSTSQSKLTQTSKVENGRTWYAVQCWNSIYDLSGRNVVGYSMDFNMDTKKHKRFIYIYYTRD